MASGPLIMYVVLRKDLLTSLNWPLGAAIAQATHAVSAVLWQHREDQNVHDYMSDVNNLRKVVLQIEGEAELKALSASLIEAKLDHKLWVEQPENVATCIAVKPYRKNDVQPCVRHLKLFG